MTNLHRHDDLQCLTVLANRRQDDDSSLIPWKLHQQLLVTILCIQLHDRNFESWSTSVSGNVYSFLAGTQKAGHPRFGEGCLIFNGLGCEKGNKQLYEGAEWIN